MATSGTINGNQSGTQPYLRIQWDVRETDIAGNRSKVRLRLYLVSPYNINFSANKSGSLEGQSFTYTGNVNGAGTYLIRTRELWIGHNSDGTKSITFDANFNINISWSGSTLSSLSVSGNATLNTIPRASSISFQGGSTAEIGKNQDLYIKINRADSSFTHHLKYSFGKKTGPITTGRISWVDHEWTIPVELANEIPNDNSGWGSIVCETYDKNNNLIGSTTTRFTATIPASWGPSVSGLTVNIAGNAVAKEMGMYVQALSQVSASFNSSANNGASLVSQKIFTSKSDGTDSGTIHASSGTSHVLNGSGEYEIMAEVKDSRGRYATAYKYITVQAYSPPVISGFSATRDPNAETYVDVFRAGSTTSLSGKNTAKLVISKRETGGSWSDISSVSFTGDFSQTYRDSGNTVTKSYDFRLVVSDKFGKRTESVVSVSTSRVVLDIHKDEGVGVGKVHEKGVMDVRGDSFFEGLVDIVGGLEVSGGITAWGGFNPIKVPANADFNDYMTVGYYYSNSDADSKTMKNIPRDRAFSLHVERHAGFKQTYTEYTIDKPDTWVRNYYNGKWGEWHRLSDFISGSNSNGRWYKYNSGLLIQHGTLQHNRNNNVTTYKTLPMTYVNTEFIIMLSGGDGSWATSEDIAVIGTGPSNTGGFRLSRHNRDSTAYRGTGYMNVNWITIGRWT